MVAYSFKGRFEDRIRRRHKIQTIRAVGKKRHARTGERITLTTGDRFHPRLMGSATCAAVLPIVLDFVANRVTVDIAVTAAVYQTPEELEVFARFDGFDSWGDLCAFWHATHGELTRFDGLLILWGDSFEAAA